MLRICQRPDAHIPNMSVQICRQAVKKARPSPYKDKEGQSPDTSSLLPFCHISRPINTSCNRMSGYLADSLASHPPESLIFSIISLNSASGSARRVESSRLRALRTKSYFRPSNASSRLEHRYASRSSLFARFLSWAFPIPFLVAVTPRRCVSISLGKIKTVIKRPSKRTPLL